MPLHLNTEDLLSARTVGSDRIEFREGWNPEGIYLKCAIAGVHAGAITKTVKILDNHVLDIKSAIADAIVSVIAGAIAQTLPNKEKEIL